MWEDMTLYWAWRSKEPCPNKTPTKKKIHYAEYESDKTLSTLAIGVFDDYKYTSLHEENKQWLLNNGFTKGREFIKWQI